jgi:uncharacterized protein
MTAGRSINYDAMTQAALLGVVRTVLTQVTKTGLPGDHHFYIAFDTHAPGVSISRRLKEKYPEEMMIVLQHRFWDLMVSEDGFEVKLTFDGIPERLVVPFPAVRVFFDPSVRFTLQFGEVAGERDGQGAGVNGRKRKDGADGERPAGRGGTQRPAAGDRRPRARQRGESEQGAGAGGAPLPAPVPTPPATFVPKSVEPAAADAGGKERSSDKSKTAVEGAEHEPAAPTGGAKVLSLDQFRKK